MIEKTMLAALCLFITALQCCEGKTQEKIFDETEEVASVIYELTKLAPARKIARDFEYRLEFANDIVWAANRNHIPHFLLTVKIYNESSFRTNVCSTSGVKSGSKTCGLGQMHGVSAKGCDLKTRRGQLDCSARWLRKCFKLCKNWAGALSAYGTDGKCEPTEIKKPFDHILRYWKSIHRQIKKWLEFEEQREHIRETIIDDIEYFNKMKEG